MSEYPQAVKALEKAKLALMLGRRKTAFFSSLICQMRQEITTRIPTAATNGLTLFYNPDFVESLNTDELLGLMLHEIGHVIYEHVSRTKEIGLNTQKMNIAGDYYINHWLDVMGYVLPDGALLDYKFAGWSTMKIYDYLNNNPDECPSDFEMDIEAPPEGINEEELVQRVESNIIKAATQAHLANEPESIPANIRQKIEDILNPKLPWNVILANYMDEYAKDDYSWKRPNRRFLPEFYLPSLHSIALNQMTFGVDVSGSTTGKTLSLIWKEVNYLWETMQPKRARLMTFDSKVQHNEMYEQGTSLDEIVLVGGGGTDVKPLLDSIQKEEPMVSLIFTDGYFTMPDMDNINTDIIWIIIGSCDFKPPKGRVIKMEEP